MQLDGDFLQFQLARYFLVCQTLADAAQHIRFAFRQAGRADHRACIKVMDADRVENIPGNNRADRRNHRVGAKGFGQKSTRASGNRLIAQIA